MNDELFGIWNILGFVPYIGDALDIADVGKDISKVYCGKAAIGLGLLAVPNIIEKPLKLTIKRLSGAEKLDIPKGERKHQVLISSSCRWKQKIGFLYLSPPT